MTPRGFLLGASVALLSTLALSAWADDAAPDRPAINFERWKEDWSILADPRVPREAFDGLKYIPLSAVDPYEYLSFGANLRERFEALDAPSFGVARSRAESYVISRLEAHGDLRINSEVQAFVQLQSDFAPGKSRLTPVDQDRVDLEQAFIAIVEPLGGGTIKFRVGRQQFAFDLQRFISVRDGPNIRQSYDALWADYELGVWRLIGFYSQPVQTRDRWAFDDYSNQHLTYGGLRIERKLGEWGNLTGYVSQFRQDHVSFPSISGNERRDIGDLRWVGKVANWDWDIEGMYQGGRISNEAISAWAFGSRQGYTFPELEWSPRLGLQLDAASGDQDRHDDHLGTFNPLFPNGYYVTLAGFTAFTNFVHFKPSLTLTPAPSLTVLLAAAGQWRETKADAIYTQPDIPVRGTAGQGSAYTGCYEQLRVDWQVTRAVAAALEAVHFQAGDTIRQAGGHDGNYLGVEFRVGW